jgi:hypothetical protein
MKKIYAHILENKKLFVKILNFIVLIDYEINKQEVFF